MSDEHGKRQSPISLIQRQAIYKNFSPFDFDKQYEQSHPANLTNTGETVAIKLNIENQPSFFGGGYSLEYVFDNIHFHWPCEHTINDLRYPLESHLVHYAKKYGDFKNALQFKDGIAVLAVFYQFSDQPNIIFDNIISNVPKIARIVDKNTHLQRPINLKQFLPSQVHQFYRYDGSLTTPDYNEVVTWTVFQTPSFISESQFQQLNRIWYDYGELLVTSNNRDLQKLHERQIFFNTGISYEAKDCCCGSGLLQSPIPIFLETCIPMHYQPFIFHRYNDLFTMSLTNTGISIILTLSNESLPPSVSRGGLFHEYVLGSIEFRWHAEHIINYYTYPLEVQLVHYAKQYGNATEAKNFKDGIAILVTLFELSSIGNEIFDTINKSIPDIVRRPNRPVILEQLINLRLLLPPEICKFCRYQGSLTSDTCDEVVTWTVFSKPNYITAQQLHHLKQISSDLNYGNNRKVQDPNERNVYLSKI